MKHGGLLLKRFFTDSTLMMMPSYTRALCETTNIRADSNQVLQLTAAGFGFSSVKWNFQNYWNHPPSPYLNNKGEQKCQNLN